MRLFDKLLKRNQQAEQLEQQLVEEKQLDENLPQRYKRESVKQRYPYGLPLNMLKSINYSKYGAILKQRQLLPPSYDRNPVGVEIRPSEHGDHNIGLIFKSKTSESYRIISIRQYNVSMAINDSFLYDYLPIMSREWENFCERIMWLYDKGFKLWHVNEIKLKDGELDL